LRGRARQKLLGVWQPGLLWRRCVSLAFSY